MGANTKADWKTLNASEFHLSSFNFLRILLKKYFQNISYVCVITDSTSERCVLEAGVNSFAVTLELIILTCTFRSSNQILTNIFILQTINMAFKELRSTKEIKDECFAISHIPAVSVTPTFWDPYWSIDIFHIHDRFNRIHVVMYNSILLEKCIIKEQNKFPTYLSSVL